MWLTLRVSLSNVNYTFQYVILALLIGWHWRGFPRPRGGYRLWSVGVKTSIQTLFAPSILSAGISP